MTPWWSKKYGKNSICAITNTRLRPGKNKYGQNYSLYLPCNHGFYRSALVSWVLTKPHQTPTCPLCRREFDPIVVFSYCL
jgi:hypothetical protein